MADAMTDSKVPSKMIFHLKKNLGENWMSVGRYLLADPNDEYNEVDCVLEDVDKRNDQLAEKSYKMLRQWQERKGHEATPQALVQALKADNLNNLAFEVEKMMNVSAPHSNPKTPAAEQPARQPAPKPTFFDTVGEFLTSILPKHTSHVWNHTQQTIRVTLTDTNDDSTARILHPDEVYKFPTPYGTVRLSVFRRASDGSFVTQVEGKIADNSDRSFIVEETEGVLTFYRALYGTIRVKDT